VFGDIDPASSMACSRRSGRLDATGCRHDDGRLCIVDACASFVRGESAEHHRMTAPAGNARSDDGSRAPSAYRSHASPLADTKAAKRACEGARSRRVAPVGVGALRPVTGGVVDQCRLIGAAAFDVGSSALARC